MSRFLYIRRVNTDFLLLLKIASCEKERESCNGVHFGPQMKGREYLELWERLAAYEKKCLLIHLSPLICDLFYIGYMRLFSLSMVHKPAVVSLKI